MSLTSPNTPIFFKINRPLRYDNSIIGTEILTVSSQENQNRTTLNSATDLVFDYRGTSKLVSVNSSKSGFRMTFKFKTRGTVEDDMADLAAADTTLTNNFWAHLFSDFKLEVGSSDVENIHNFGIVYDAVTALQSNTFKQHGFSAGYIPDETDGTAADRGHAKRKLFYNYALPGNEAAQNAEFREVGVFVPIRYMSGFCDSFNRLTTNLSHRFTLRRTGTTVNAYSGAAGTTMELYLSAIKLELEAFTPNNGLKADYLGEIEKSKELEVAFTAYNSVKQGGVTSTSVMFSESQFAQARTLIVCAKDAATNNSQTANYGVYTNADIKDITHEIQARMYPSKGQDGNFGKNRFEIFIRDSTDVALKEHNSTSLNGLTFKNLYPFFAIDVSGQEPAPNNKPLNIKTEIERNSARPANIDVYLIIQYERHYKIDMMRDSMTQA